MWLIVKDEKNKPVAKIPDSFIVLSKLTKELAIEKGYTVEEVEDKDSKATTHGFIDYDLGTKKLLLVDSISVCRSPDQFYAGMTFPNGGFVQFPYCWNIEFESSKNPDYPIEFRLVVMDKQCIANKDDDHKTMIINGFAKTTYVGCYDFHYEPPTMD